MAPDEEDAPVSERPEGSADVPSADESEPVEAEADAPEPTAEEIRASLQGTGGNIVRAAYALGLSSRYALYRLMRKHGIEADGERARGG